MVGHYHKCMQCSRNFLCKNGNVECSRKRQSVCNSCFSRIQGEEIKLGPKLWERRIHDVH